MKKILFLLFVTGAALQFYGQGTVTITSGTKPGTAAGTWLVLDNLHLANNGIWQQASGEGTLKFMGAMETNLSGSGTTTLSQLLLAKGAGRLNLQTGIGVVKELTFESGLLNLGNSAISLGSTGRLTGESETSRAYTTGTGYIEATATLNKPSSVNPGNLGAVLTSAVNLGVTTIRRGHAVQSVGTGSSIERYYDIAPTNNRAINTTLRFYYFDAELNGQAEAALVLWRSNSSWDNLGFNQRDAAANYVEKRNIQSFARMTLASSTGCNLAATIPDVYAVRPGGAANTLYIGYGPTSLTLSAQVSGGTPPYSYKWTAGSPGGDILGTGATLSVSPTTVTTYYLNVTDAVGCTAAPATKTINVVDVRCGAKLDMVTVCVRSKGKNPTYTTQCVAYSKVAGYLGGGGTLGACSAGIAPITQAAEANSLQASVVPNPAPYYFTLVTSSPLNEPLTIKVADAAGRLIETRQGVAPNGTLVIGRSYRPGLYYAEVVQGAKKVVVRMVKQSE